MPSPPADADEVPPRRWFEDGLRFACTACGNCCRHHGEYAYVYLRRPEARALAAHLGLGVEEFLARYCQREGHLWALRMDDPACPFLAADGRCGVYPVRPVQCRTWPFWEETLGDEATWQGEVSATCPGIGSGPLHSADEVERIAEANEAWYDGDLARWSGPEPRG